MTSRPPLRAEPVHPRAVTFIDGQNLFHGAREAFGYTYPNYDPLKLARAICTACGWVPIQTRFYTGVPPPERCPRWHRFWSRKLLRMSRSGVRVVSRPVRYVKEDLPDGTTIHVAREKGIDVRIAIDVMKLAIDGTFDVCLMFSQDQDFAELVPEVQAMARRQNRWIKMVSAFPVGPGTVNRKGIRDTDWIRIARSTYDACLDQ